MAYIAKRVINPMTSESGFEVYSVETKSDAITKSLNSETAVQVPTSLGIYNTQFIQDQIDYHNREIVEWGKKLAAINLVPKEDVITK